MENLLVFAAERIAKRVHPHGQLSSSAAPCYFTSKKETFTIWMKSLVLNGKGCTVFDSSGHIMYRVDNYNSKHSNEVYLMDFNGRVLFTILRKKKFRLFDFWEGYRSCTDKPEMKNPKKPGFQVRKSFRILSRSSECDVILGLDNDEPYKYMMKTSCSLRSKSACKILDNLGEIVAEVKRKEARSGVVLGDDVWTLEVKPCVDHSLITAIVVVYSLIYCKM